MDFSLQSFRSFKKKELKIPVLKLEQCPAACWVGKKLHSQRVIVSVHLS